MAASAMDAMQRATRTVPVVFVVVPDPIGAGYADTVAPGGNATGFSQFEFWDLRPRAGAAEGDHPGREDMRGSSATRITAGPVSLARYNPFPLPSAST